MHNHKDLPGGSQSWAEEVTGYRERIDELEAIVRRMVNDFGLDYSNPTRAMNTGTSPSVQKSVQLKLPSLNDLDIRDAVDGDLLTFDGKRGMWVARRHNTVQIPKVFPQGDPASYYVAPLPTQSGLILADTWTVTKAVQNIFTDSAFGTIAVFDPSDGFNPGNSQDVVGISHAAGQLEVALNCTADVSNGHNYLMFDLPLDAYQMFGKATLRDLVVPSGAIQPDLPPPVYQEIYYYDATGALAGQKTYDPIELSQTSTDWVNLKQSSGLNGTTAGAVRVKGVLSITMPWRGGSGRFLFDNFLVHRAGENPPYTAAGFDTYFDGSTSGTNEVRFTWDGTAGSSTSTATTLQRLKYPANIPVGVPFQVLGEGFQPGASVLVETYPEGNGGGYYSQNVTASTQGTFETSFTLATNDPLGTGYIYAYDSASSFRYSPSATYNITAS